jgi:post-segregation antitoxin (ccd killing protein)
MTELKITIPDRLASEAREAGLLTTRAIQSLLRAAMRQRAATRSFLANAKRVADAGVRPMSEDEIQAEVVAARKARRRDRAAPRR